MELSGTKRAAAIIAFGVLAAMGLGTRQAAGARVDHLTYLTFSRSVALPGVTLSPGTYAFELRTPDTAANVVLVRDRARKTPMFSGMTHRSPRPANWSEKRQIVFGEAGPGEAAPILAWYPVDNSLGFEFIYQR